MQDMTEQFLRLRSVMDLTGLSRASCYRLLPPPLKLGERCSAWRRTEIEMWMAERIAASRAQKAA